MFKVVFMSNKSAKYEIMINTVRHEKNIPHEFHKDFTNFVINIE